MGIRRYVSIINHLDYLVRTRQTGSPKELAVKLRISEWTVYNYLKQMKALGAPIVFSGVYKSYVYTEHCDFVIGFFRKGDKITPKPTLK